MAKVLRWNSYVLAIASLLTFANTIRNPEESFDDIPPEVYKTIYNNDCTSQTRLTNAQFEKVLNILRKSALKSVTRTSDQDDPDDPEDNPEISKRSQDFKEYPLTTELKYAIIMRNNIIKVLGYILYNFKEITLDEIEALQLVINSINARDVFAPSFLPIVNNLRKHYPKDHLEVFFESLEPIAPLVLKCSVILLKRSSSKPSWKPVHNYLINDELSFLNDIPDSYTIREKQVVPRAKNYFEPLLHDVNSRKVPLTKNLASNILMVIPLSFNSPQVETERRTVARHWGRHPAENIPVANYKNVYDLIRDAMERIEGPNYLKLHEALYKSAPFRSKPTQYKQLAKVLKGGFKYPVLLNTFETYDFPADVVASKNELLNALNTGVIDVDSLTSNIFNIYAFPDVHSMLVGFLELLSRTISKNSNLHDISKALYIHAKHKLTYPEDILEAEFDVPVTELLDSYRNINEPEMARTIKSLKRQLNRTYTMPYGTSPRRACRNILTHITPTPAVETFLNMVDKNGKPLQTNKPYNHPTNIYMEPERVDPKRKPRYRKPSANPTELIPNTELPIYLPSSPSSETNKVYITDESPVQKQPQPHMRKYKILPTVPTAPTAEVTESVETTRRPKHRKFKPVDREIINLPEKVDISEENPEIIDNPQVEIQRKSRPKHKHHKIKPTVEELTTQALRIQNEEPTQHPTVIHTERKSNQKSTVQSFENGYEEVHHISTYPEKITPQHQQPATGMSKFDKDIDKTEDTTEASVKSKTHPRRYKNQNPDDLEDFIQASDEPVIVESIINSKSPFVSSGRSDNPRMSVKTKVFKHRKPTPYFEPTNEDYPMEPIPYQNGYQIMQTNPHKIPNEEFGMDYVPPNNGFYNINAGMKSFQNVPDDSNGSSLGETSEEHVVGKIDEYYPVDYSSGEMSSFQQGSRQYVPYDRNTQYSRPTNFLPIQHYPSHHNRYGLAHDHQMQPYYPMHRRNIGGNGRDSSKIQGYGVQANLNQKFRTNKSDKNRQQDEQIIENADLSNENWKTHNGNRNVYVADRQVARDLNRRQMNRTSRNHLENGGVVTKLLKHEETSKEEEEQKQLMSDKKTVVEDPYERIMEHQQKAENEEKKQNLTESQDYEHSEDPNGSKTMTSQRKSKNEYKHRASRTKTEKHHQKHAHPADAIDVEEVN